MKKSSNKKAQGLNQLAASIVAKATKANATPTIKAKAKAGGPGSNPGQ